MVVILQPVGVGVTLQWLGWHDRPASMVVILKPLGVVVTLILFSDLAGMIGLPVWLSYFSLWWWGLLFQWHGRCGIFPCQKIRVEFCIFSEILEKRVELLKFFFRCLFVKPWFMQEKLLPWIIFRWTACRLIELRCAPTHAGKSILYS